LSKDKLDIEAEPQIDPYEMNGKGKSPNDKS
jgi:hypothetical protein